MTEEDAVQCAAEVFCRCLRYCEGRGGRIDNPKWFMGIYKLSLHNEFNSYATACGCAREADGEWAAQQHLEEEDVAFNAGPLTVALKQASSELQEVMMAVAQAPVELLQMLLQEASDENWSRRLCRLVGIRVSDTIVAELREILTPDT